MINFALLIFYIFPALSTGLVYEGLLKDSQGKVISESNVQVLLEILNETQSCVVFARTHELNLSSSNGEFSLPLDSGEQLSQGPHKDTSFSKALSNHTGNTLPCSTGGSVTYGGSYAKRFLRLTITEVNQVNISDITLPAVELKKSAYSREAETTNTYHQAHSGDFVGQISSTSVKKIQGTGVSATSPTDGQTLTYLSGTGLLTPTTLDENRIDSNTISYDRVDFASENGITFPTLASSPNSPENGQTFYNDTASSSYFYNGTGWINLGIGEGDFKSDGSKSVTGNLRLNGQYLSGDGTAEGLHVDNDGKVAVGHKTTNSAIDISVSGGLNSGLRISDSQDSNNTRLQVRTDGSGTGIITGSDSSESLRLSFNGGNDSFLLSPLAVGAASAEGLYADGVIRTTASVSNSTPTIDFATGNLQHTTSSCGAMNLHNLKNGGVYNLAVQGTTSAACSFSGYSDSGTTAISVVLPPDHGITVAGQHTVYSFIVVGTTAYVGWVKEFD